MQQRVSESENRANTLEAQVADLQATQESIIARLTQIRQDLETALDPMRSQQADRGENLRALEAEVAALKQQVLLLSDEVARLGEAATSTPSRRVGGAMPPPDTIVPRSTGAPPAFPSGAASEQDSIFSAAYMDYTAGQYVLAVDGFQEFLSRYPDARKAPDALYWIGESLAAQEDHTGARQRFLQIPQRYPTTEKIPDAKLRAALEAVELGQLNDAIRELRELVSAHRGSDAALIGCMQLDRMGQQLPPGCQAPL